MMIVRAGICVLSVGAFFLAGGLNLLWAQSAPPGPVAMPTYVPAAKPTPVPPALPPLPSETEGLEPPPADPEVMPTVVAMPTPAAPPAPTAPMSVPPTESATVPAAKAVPPATPPGTPEASPTPEGAPAAPPAEAAPAAPAPAPAGQAEQAPAAPVEGTPANAAPENPTPESPTPAEAAPAETPPAQATPAEATPAETTPPEEAPAAEAVPVEPDPNAPPPVVPGTISIAFAPEAGDLPAGATGQLGEIAQKMLADESMRIKVMCYAASTPDNENKARRKSMSRGFAVRRYLMQAGIVSTRIELHALGGQIESQSIDRVDIIPAS